MKHIFLHIFITLISSIPISAQTGIEENSDETYIEEIGIYKSIPFNREEALTALTIHNELDEITRMSLIEIIENYYEQLPCITNIDNEDLNSTVIVEPALEGQKENWVYAYDDFTFSQTVYVKGLSNDELYIAWEEKGKYIKTGHKSIYRYENSNESTSKERKTTYHETVEKENQSASQIVLSEKDETIATTNSSSSAKTVIRDVLTHYKRKLVIIIANFESCSAYDSPEIICGTAISGWIGDPSSDE